MLAEVAASSLEATHISHPLRTALRRTDVVRGRVAGIDLDRRCVVLAPDPHSPAAQLSTHDEARVLPFEHLVLALGAVSNFLALTQVA